MQGTMQGCEEGLLDAGGWTRDQANQTNQTNRNTPMRPMQLLDFYFVGPIL